MQSSASGIAILPVSHDGMELDDGLLLGLRELSVLEVRAKVVRPPQPAALPTSLQPCEFSSANITSRDQQHFHHSTYNTTSVLGDESPISCAMLGDVRGELVVFFQRPLAPLHVLPLTTWNPTHLLSYRLGCTSSNCRLIQGYLCWFT